MFETYTAHFLSPAKEYIESIDDADKGAIAADIDIMRGGDLQTPHTKQLKGPIRELISGHHRITYFVNGRSLYFVRGFRKKTSKTPKREIDYAEHVYKQMK